MRREDVAFYGLSAAATSSAWVLAWRRRQHLPVAVLFVVGILGDMGQRWLAPLLRDQPRPFTGDARVAWTLKQALFTSYPPAVVVVALVVLARAPRWSLVLPLGAWLAIVAAHIFGYPELRQAALGTFYLGLQVAAVGVLAVLAMRFEVHRRRRRVPPTAAELVVLWSVLAEAINLGGPLLREPWRRWGLARVAYGAVYVVAIIVQIVEGVSSWRRSGKWSDPPSSSG